MHIGSNIGEFRKIQLAVWLVCELNIGECCSFDDCVFMAETNSDFECPHTLHHMDATPSMFFYHVNHKDTCLLHL